MADNKLETATLAGGCFWCTEAVFQKLKGVEKVESGYMGGTLKNPTSMQVYTEDTGHAESVQIHFDPTVLSYEELLDVFFHLHDPTTLNRQGPDIGTMYRSAIFFHSEEQKKKAQEVKEKVQSDFADPVVTEIMPATQFYKAEDYHQDFYNSGQRPGYCRLVIDPKIQKLYKEYSKKLKPEASN